MINKIKEILSSCPKDRQQCTINQLIEVIDKIDNLVNSDDINDILTKEANEFFDGWNKLDNIDKKRYIDAWKVKHTPTSQDIIDLVHKSGVVDDSVLELYTGSNNIND